MRRAWSHDGRTTATSSRLLAGRITPRIFSDPRYVVAHRLTTNSSASTMPHERRPLISVSELRKTFERAPNVDSTPKMGEPPTTEDAKPSVTRTIDTQGLATRQASCRARSSVRAIAHDTSTDPYSLATSERPSRIITPSSAQNGDRSSPPTEASTPHRKLPVGDDYLAPTENSGPREFTAAGSAADPQTRSIEKLPVPSTGHTTRKVTNPGNIYDEPSTLKHILSRRRRKGPSEEVKVEVPRQITVSTSVSVTRSWGMEAVAGNTGGWNTTTVTSPHKVSMEGPVSTDSNLATPSPASPVKNKVSLYESLSRSAGRLGTVSRRKPMNDATLVRQQADVVGEGSSSRGRKCGASI